MTAHHWVYDSHYLQAAKEPGSAPEPYAHRSVMEYGLPLLFLYSPVLMRYCMLVCVGSFVVEC